MNAAVIDTAERESARDAGLKRSIGVVGLTAALVNIIVGGGIFNFPGAIAAAAGPYAIFAYIACALAVGAVAACCAEAGSRVPSSGGIYGYVDAAFGPLAGFVAGAFLWIGCVLAAGGIAAGFAGALGAFVPALASPVARAGVIVVTIGLITAVNCISTQAAARAISLATAVKLVPLLVFVGVGVFFIDPAKLGAGPPVAVAGMGRALLMALFVFQGMETVLGVNGELRAPGRTLPLGLLSAMAICAGLYIAIQLVAQGLLGADLAGAQAPLAKAAALIDPRLGGFLLAGTLLSLFAWLGSDILGSPRALFAMSRDGYLPAAFGRLSGKGATPVFAIVFHAGVAALLAISGTFEQLAVLSALAACVLYIGACLAAWSLRRRGVALLGEPLSLRGLPVLATVGVLSMAAAIVLARPVEIAATAAMAVVSCGYYWLVRRRRT